MSEVAAAFAFVAEHWDLISLIGEALDKGVRKGDIVNAVKDLLTALSDAEMQREFPNG